MNHITLFPSDIVAMSVNQLAQLSPDQKHEIDTNLNEALVWLKQVKSKFDAALEQSYGEQARKALADSGRDVGSTYITDGSLRIKFELPKRVSWDQQQLTAIAERIVAAGDRIQDYMDVEFSVAESKFNNWPATLKEQLAPARTVKPGKAKFLLTLEHSESYAETIQEGQ